MKLMYRRHDVGLQIVGQPARDLVRHFIQRYDYDRHLFLVYYLLYRQMEMSAENKGLYMSGSAPNLATQSWFFTESHTSNVIITAAA